MKVDLEHLRTAIAKELQEVERRQSALRENLAHIEAVERMVKEDLKAGEVDDQLAQPERPRVKETSQTTEGKSWFRR